MDTVSAAALRRLPRELGTALEQGGLDDASTLANYTHALLADLQSRGFGVDPVGETGSTGSIAALDTDVATNGTTAGMRSSLLSVFYRVSYRFFSFLSPSPFSFSACPLPLPFVVRQSVWTVCASLNEQVNCFYFANRCSEVWQTTEQEAREDSTTGRVKESWSSAAFGSFD